MRPESPPRLLVVDDDATIRKSLVRTLGKSGYDVLEAEDGATALHLAFDTNPDVVLLDIVMPGMDGYEVCKRLQEHEDLSYTPVIFVTSLDSEQDAARAFAHGGADYVRKPFELKELLAKLEKHLANRWRWTEVAQKTAPAGDWMVPGRFAELTRYLAQERGSSTDRKQLMEQCSPDRLYDLCRVLNLPEDQLARYVSRFLSLPFVQRVHADDVVLGALPVPFCQKNLVVPVRSAAGGVGVVLSNPFSWELVESLNRSVWRDADPDVSIAAPDTINMVFEDTADRVLRVPTVEEGLKDLGLQSPQNGDLPVIDLANELLSAAVSERASDVHIEPKDRHTLVRFRIDGDMQEIRTLEHSSASRLISRFKALAGMDIAERRKPQDGSVEVLVGERRLKLRLATSSTTDGETLVVRLLEPTHSAKALGDLGMTEIQVEQASMMADRHQGMILIVGPTGSGKSTTIFSMLTRVDGRTRSIMSVEDPVEYRIPFANQQQVHEAGGVTFESLLKSAMRQDPDILFLGEIRDPYSAKASLDFASSGHLTVSTLHSSNATTAIFRLERLGVERSSMADSLLGIVAQKLVKRLCPHCKQLGAIESEEAALLAPFTDDVPDEVARPSRCPACRETGYIGRDAVFEILRFDPTLSEMVRAGSSINQIRAFSVDRGEFMMYHHAVEKVRDLRCSPRDAYELVLLEEMQFRQASDAREAIQQNRPAPEHPSADSDEEGAAELVTEPDPEGADLAASDPSASDPESAPAAEEPASPSILLVEDDLDTQALIQLYLKGAGYDLTTASDGVEALMELGQRSFDVVLSDINMPNLDGITLIEMLTVKGVDIPVIFLTAELGEDVEGRVLEAGAADFIRKPISKPVLLGRVKNVLGRRTSAHAGR